MNARRGLGGIDCVEVQSVQKLRLLIRRKRTAGAPSTWAPRPPAQIFTVNGERRRSPRCSLHRIQRGIWRSPTRDSRACRADHLGWSRRGVKAYVLALNPSATVHVNMTGNVRWQTIAYVARLTGLSDETIRKYCIATPKVHFPNARLVDERWEIPDDEVRAAYIIDRSLIVGRSGLTESRLTQLERLGKLACSNDGKFSLDQEVFLHSVKAVEDLASVPLFEERRAPRAVTGLGESVALDAPAAAASAAVIPGAAGLPGLAPSQGQRQQQTEVVLVRPGIALMDEFRAYMTDHKDPARLPDEFFAGEYAPEFIPPVGVKFHVALGPGGRGDDEQPWGTWVCRYPQWGYDGKNLRWEGECEICIPGFYSRGSIPDEYGEDVANYRLLRGLWNARAAEARSRLREKARIARVAFLPDFAWRPDVRNWVVRYQRERLHPSEFPDSVKAGLVDVAFIPTYNMFFYASTGEVISDGAGGAFTIIGLTPGFSDEFGMVDSFPLEPLPAHVARGS